MSSSVFITVFLLQLHKLRIITLKTCDYEFSTFSIIQLQYSLPLNGDHWLMSVDTEYNNIPHHIFFATWYRYRYISLVSKMFLFVVVISGNTKFL